MKWEAWYTIAVLALGVLVMAKDIFGADFAMMAILIALMLPGSRVLPLKKGLEGFSNSGLLTVASALSVNHCEGC
jgi:predicted branched-subunit amino acid permease